MWRKSLEIKALEVLMVLGAYEYSKISVGRFDMLNEYDMSLLAVPPTDRAFI